jgi:hypothetical protein
MDEIGLISLQSIAFLGQNAALRWTLSEIVRRAVAEYLEKGDRA